MTDDNENARAKINRAIDDLLQQSPELSAFVEDITHDVELAVAEVKQAVDDLLATTDIKQAMTDTISKAHDDIHKLAITVALIAEMASRLEPSTEDAPEGLTPELAEKNLKGFLSHVNAVSKPFIDASTSLCGLHALLLTGKPIPGKLKGQAEVEVVRAEDTDFSQFMTNLTKPGNA